MECFALPKGWKREESTRKSGLCSGKMDVVYHSPNGVKFRSKPQLARYLGESVDLTSFDFRTGKINPSLLRRGKRQKGDHKEFGRGMRESALIPPIRQTASIFKQPVTVIRSQSDSQNGKTKHDLKHGPATKPKQLFWEKRLENLRARSVDQEDFEKMDLPRNIKAVGPNMSEDTALRSISTALHMHSQPVVGQSKANEKNFSVNINPEQPLVSTLDITEFEIQRQEQKVHSARKKLETAINLA